MNSGGLSDEISNLIINGKYEKDMFSFDIRRFHNSYTDNFDWIEKNSHESYTKNYFTFFPFDQA